MLEILKTGKTQYGSWVYGVLKYNGFEIRDIFSLNKEINSDEKTLQPKKVYLYRTKNDKLRFKIEI